MRATAVAWVLLAAAGCSARPGGSLPHAAPPSGGEPAPAPGEVGPAPAASLAGVSALARAPFFRGLEHVAAPLPSLAGLERSPQATAAGLQQGGWYVVEIPTVVRAASDRFRAAGRRAPRILLALGFSARASKSPSACADALLDPAVLGRSLDADESKAEGGTGAAGAVRTHSLALLDRGKGPFRFDFRWSFRADRAEAPGGAVLVRYELLPTPAPENIAAFQGTVALVPDGDGTRVLEVLVLGSDVSLPFFLVGQAGQGVKQILGIRAQRLAKLLR